MANPNSRQRVYAYVKPDRFVIENMETAAVWTASTDVTDIATTTTHREGTSAISFDKDGTTEAFGMISKTLDTERQLNLVDYLRGKLRLWISLSALTDIASVDLLIGESASHHYVYRALDSSLTTGYNEIAFDVDSPSSQVGGGAAWSSIGWIAVRVNFDGASDVLTAILVDAITIQNETEVKVENLSIAGTGLATSAKQDTGNASLASIVTALQIMDDWDESDRAKVNIIAGQAGIDGGAGAVSDKTVRVIDAVPTTKTAVDTTYTATTTSGTAVAANANRKGLYITNTSATRVSLNVTDAAVVDQGITLLPGASYTMEQRDFTTGLITAITPSGTAVLSIMEYV